ncbi:inner membrane-spanning protein YciB [Thiococcus pfennigii]|jgi:intracellular septation protein|uniref:inner membrane-spanning protein YciB n=1 Tax=Thiococcus pfennigii TaxID=1057 RepID=UPI0019068794|nr:inner membrane-spanning protein YciB [Thiococcus pfennigii]MBK1699849.1 septation protein A [Thiococcus pfennigii]MBK1731639.1 septation protein A [Thiococcus pfennigii]
MKLLSDFFPILLFFVAYQLFDIYVATAVAILASAIQVGGVWLRRRRVETMPLVTLALLVVFGGLTLLLHDRTFIMWKPSIVNWLFAAAFLGSHFIGERTLIERLMGQTVRVPAPVWRRLNLLWVGFFMLAGVVNLAFANGFFTAEAALIAAAGQTDIDLAQCAAQFGGAVLTLCENAYGREQLWVNFKLFGMLGLTILFVIAQSFYLARHIEEPAPQPMEAN